MQYGNASFFLSPVCSVLQPSSIRELATPLHLSLSSVILINSSMMSPVHVLMLSVQAVRGLSRLRAPCIVPCIISFSRQRQLKLPIVSSWCDHTCSMLAPLLWQSVIVQSVHCVYIQAATSPVSWTYFAYGTSVVSINASTDYRLSVGAYPDALYDPVYLEITVPYDNTSTVFSICRVELVRVGEHLPCVNQSRINASVTYYTMYAPSSSPALLRLSPSLSVCLLALDTLDLYSKVCRSKTRLLLGCFEDV